MRRRLLVLVLPAVAAYLAACGKKAGVAVSDRPRYSYDSEVDWDDPQRVIPLGYGAAQGKRIFYQQCVWCHADATPAGPSNRSNVTPTPPLLNDGNALNGESDEFLQNIISFGGGAMGKSAMMPPYGKTLTQEDVRSLIAYARAIAVPAYQPPARSGAKYPGK